ncbi:MAG TPA: hypothetical protein VK574_16395 [Terracidiphilus sp.]|nr:hypothetical protein [Terracidiphilus sp.]
MLPRSLLGLSTALCLAALALTTTLHASASSPVAYVYVAESGAIQAYATAADGTMTKIQSQPTAGAIWHLSVTKKFLYGIDGSSDISEFSIGSNGKLTPIGTMAASDYDPGNCFASGILQVDVTGTNVYADVSDCDGESYVVSFKIGSTGQLEFLGKAFASEWAISQLRFTSNNLYAFQTGCHITAGTAGIITSETPVTTEYKRESNGYLTYVETTADIPEGSGDKTFCPFNLASHGNQLVFEYLRYLPGEFYGVDYPLGNYTVSSDGKLSTKSDYANMAATPVYPRAISISPSGAILATGGDEGYQFFHFSGSSQPVKWTGPFATNGMVTELGWDKTDHFYALTESSLIEYHITSTSYKKLAGVPNAFTSAGSVIVLSLN